MTRPIVLLVFAACPSAGCATRVPVEKASLVAEVFRTPSQSLNCVGVEVPYCRTRATRVVAAQEESCRCMNPFTHTHGNRWR